MKHIITVVLAFTAVVGCAGSDTYELEIGSATLEVEVAASAEERALGLMFRESLEKNAGMLFVFEDSAIRAFYMRNTQIPLSIAYIDERLVIREIHDMEPFSLESIVSRNPAMYALELNQGAFERLGIEPGDRLRPSERLQKHLSR